MDAPPDPISPDFAITDVIAERDFTEVLEDGTFRIVTLRIGRPQPWTAEGGFYCPFEFRGLYSRIFYAAGEDPLFAVQSALRLIPAHLKTLRKKRNLFLHTEGDNLGFGELG